MGATTGHIALGLVFILVGTWHLFNHTKLHLTLGHRYNSPLPWFPTPFNISRHLELYFLMIGCAVFSMAELNHWPLLDPDGSFPSHRLRHFEHTSMAMFFFLYALFALLFDIKDTKSPQATIKPRNDVIWCLVSLAFAQELLLFHFHSTDHVGVERQYHLLLEFIVIVCLGTTLMGIGFSRSFIVGFVRSVAVILQGVWLVIMGVMLWTPELIPKGCFIREENGRDEVECEEEMWVERGKALVNLLFSWTLIGFAGFVVLFYLAMGRVYGGGFVALPEEEEVSTTAERCRENVEDNIHGFDAIYLEK